MGLARKKSIVQCNVGNKRPVFVCCLFPEKAECCQLNLEFEESDEVVFSVIGPRAVHLTGYYLPTSSLNHHNDESYPYFHVPNLLQIIGFFSTFSINYVA